MNKKFTTILAALFVLFTASVVIGCNNAANPDSTPDPTVLIAKVAITMEDEVLAKYKAHPLYVGFEIIVRDAARKIAGDETIDWDDASKKTISFQTEKIFSEADKNDQVSVLQALVDGAKWTGKAAYDKETKTININITAVESVVITSVNLIDKSATSKVPKNDPKLFDTAVTALRKANPALEDRYTLSEADETAGVINVVGKRENWAVASNAEFDAFKVAVNLALKDSNLVIGTVTEDMQKRSIYTFNLVDINTTP